MPSNMKISLLALVGAAAAVPHYSAHSRLHHKPSGGYAGPTAGWAGQNYTQPAPTGGASVVPLDDSTTTLLETDYSTVTIKKTVYLTLSPSPVETPSAVAAADYSTGPAASGPAACGPATVTVTATNKVTVTVPASGAPSSPAGNAPSSPAGGAPSYPAGGASSPAYTPPSTPEASSVVPQKPSSVPAYSASFVLASSSVAKVEQPSSEAPKSTPAATPEAYTSSTPTSSPVAVSSYVAPSSAKASSAAPSSSPSSSPSYSGGKRGLAYRWDGAADCKTFEGKNFGFAWNWEADSKGDIGSIPFIPTLRTLDNAGDWSSKVEAAISGGSKVAFGLNEPDIASQANLGVSAACDAWKQYMNPIKEKHSDVVLVGPFVSSSENAGQGLDYLSQFYKQCPDAQTDAAGIHWYGPSTAGFDAFKAHVDKAIQQTGKKVWITEFGLTGATAEESASFLKQAQEYLDNNDSCSGYSYYAVGSFDATANLLGTANSLTATGDVYVS